MNSRLHQQIELSNPCYIAVVLKMVFMSMFQSVCVTFFSFELLYICSLLNFMLNFVRCLSVSNIDEGLELF